MCIYNLTIKVEARALTQNRTTEKSLTFKPLRRKRNIIFVFFLFANFNFGRLKFDLDPMIDYDVKLIFTLLNDFGRRLSLQISLVELPIF